MGAVCCGGIKKPIYKYETIESIQDKEGVWIVTVDNIFLDVAKEIESDDWLVKENIVPGSQNTALTPAMKNTAKKILNAPAT